ncbi:MAG: DNA-binding transcriptional regulator [Sedimentisphaerales bacterium]|nr:DNA-binding transcriptional regulator [Sedimentisphaerales bacterium]
MERIPKIILLMDSGRAAGRTLIQGITKYVHLHGPWVFFRELSYYQMIHSRPGTNIYNAKGRAVLRQILHSGGVDGFLADIPDTEIAREILPHGFPAVLIPGRERIEDFINLDCSEENAGKMAAEYYLDLGFEHFAACGYTRSYWSRMRLESFRKRLEEAGYEVYTHNQTKKGGGMFWEEEFNAIASWLRQLPKPLAVWAYNDDFAAIVVEAARSLDLIVPDEVAVLGVDNDKLLCELCNPPLSSVALNHEKSGYEMAELLAQLIKGHKPQKSVVNLRATHVVGRQSTSIQAVQDTEVARAVRFIRENAYRPIQVDDVLRQVTISRRTLYDRFTQVLGRSISSEIRRQRVEIISKSLLTTHDTIAQIAYKYGFPGPDHVSRYFSSVKGITPQKYRKAFSLR